MYARKALNMLPTLSKGESAKIEMAGYRAYLAGEPPTANPHKYGSEAETLRSRLWAAGYAASRTDRARANRAATGTSQAEQ